MPVGRWWGWGVLAATFASLPFRAIPEQVDALWPLGQAPSPYLRLDHGLLLYLLAPLSALTTFIAFLAPGLLLVGVRRRPGATLARAVLVSIAATIAVGTSVKLILGLPLSQTGFVAGWLALTTGIAFGRHRRSADAREASWLEDSGRWGVIIGATFLALAVMAPKIYWEDLHVDGVEAFEYGRSLNFYYLPHWEFHHGDFAFSYPLSLFIWPNHFFIQWFGPLDGAVRLQFFLHMAIVSGLVLELAEAGAARRLSRLEAGFVGLGLVLVGFVQAYGTSYDVFSTDLAESPGLDLLWMVVTLAAISALWAGEWGWSFAIAAVSFAASPGAPLIMGGLACAVFVIGPAEDRKNLPALLAGLAAGAVVKLLHHQLYVQALVGSIKDQFSPRNMLARLWPPTFHWRRVSLILFPSGIVPALTLVLPRWADRRQVVLSLLCLGFFGVLSFSVWTGVHQFTPVMFMPLVVFGRWLIHSAPSLGSPGAIEEPGRASRRRWLGAYAVGLVISLGLSLPPHFELNQHTRAVGFAMRFEIGDDAYDYPEAARAAPVVYEILPEEYRLHYPRQPWGADHLAVLRYALRRPQLPERQRPPVNYVVTSSVAPPPPGGRLAGIREGAALYVLDDGVLKAHLNPDYPRRSLPAIYDHVNRQAAAFYRSVAGVSEPPE